MATQILAVGTGAATSSDFTVVAGTPALVFLNDAAGPTTKGCQADILAKDPAGQYYRVGELRSGVRNGSTVIVVAGVYQFKRPADSAACGVASA
nr:hypothetical protein [uncultured Dongia sp.]